MPGPSSCRAAAARTRGAACPARRAPPVRSRRPAGPPTRPRARRPARPADPVLAGVGRCGHGARHSGDVGLAHVEPWHRRGLGAIAPSRARASGPCTARMARLAVVSSPPMAATTPSVWTAFGMTSKRSSSLHHIDDVVEHRRVVGVEQVGVLRAAWAHLGEVVRERGLERAQASGPCPRRCRGGSRRTRRRRCGTRRCSASVPAS